MQGVIIRNADISDLDAVTELESRCFPMYSISTETGKVIFDPRTFSDDSVITDNEKEK